MFSECLQIGEASFDPRSREISRGGVKVRLQPKAAAVLSVLAARPGQVVSRTTFFDACWDHGEGSDEALTQLVAQIRRALGDKARRPVFVETVAKDGYRLIAPVTQTRRGPAPVAWAAKASRGARLRPALLFSAVALLVALVLLGQSHAVRHFLRHGLLG